jgi:hypothetical protein
VSARIVGRRAKAGADPSDFFRYDTTASPSAMAQRFVMGFWRDNSRATPGEPTTVSLSSDVQRGLRVDLEVSTFGKVEDFSNVERIMVTYPGTLANGMNAGLSRGASEAWQPLIATNVLHIITQTRFTLGTHSWWLVEQGLVVPTQRCGHIALKGELAGDPQVAIFSTEPAARKAYTQFTTERMSGEPRLIAIPANGKGIASTNAQLGAGLALNWMEQFAAEEKAREEERRKAAEAAAVLAQQQAVEREREAERQRRIAAGDVTVLDDTSLAEKLRRKRAVGG